MSRRGTKTESRSARTTPAVSAAGCVRQTVAEPGVVETYRRRKTATTATARHRLSGVVPPLRATRAEPDPSVLERPSARPNRRERTTPNERPPATRAVRLRPTQPRRALERARRRRGAADDLRRASGQGRGAARAHGGRAAPPAREGRAARVARHRDDDRPDDRPRVSRVGRLSRGRRRSSCLLLVLLLLLFLLLLFFFFFFFGRNRGRWFGVLGLVFFFWAVDLSRRGGGVSSRASHRFASRLVISVTAKPRDLASSSQHNLVVGHRQTVVSSRCTERVVSQAV